MFFRPEHELHKRRRGRNLGLGMVLAAFVALVFGLTVVKVTNLGKVQGFKNVVVPEPMSQPATAPQSAETRP